MIYACDAAKNDLQLGVAKKNEYVLQMAESRVVIYPSNTLLITQARWELKSWIWICFFVITFFPPCSVAL